MSVRNPCTTDNSYCIRPLHGFLNSAALFVHSFYPIACFAASLYGFMRWAVEPFASLFFPRPISFCGLRSRADQKWASAQWAFNTAVCQQHFIPLSHNVKESINHPTAPRTCAPHGGSIYHERIQLKRKPALNYRRNDNQGMTTAINHMRSGRTIHR